MGAYRKGKKNLTPEQQVDILKRNAGIKNKKSNVVPMRKPEKK